MSPRPRLFGPRPKSAELVEAEKPLSKRHVDEIVQVIACTIAQARRRELDDGSVQYTFSREADAKMRQRLDRLYGGRK